MTPAEQGQPWTCPPLAYGILVRGGCRRLGGAGQCGICVADLRPEEQERARVAQKSDAVAAERKESGGGSSRTQNTKPHSVASRTEI